MRNRIQGWRWIQRRHFYRGNVLRLVHVMSFLAQPPPTGDDTDSGYALSGALRI